MWQRHWDIEMRHTDIDMLQDDRTVAKDMTVDSMTVRTMDSWQDQKQKNCISTTTNAENLFVWQWHCHINVTEILINCSWFFFERYSKWKSLNIKLFSNFVVRRLHTESNQCEVLRSLAKSLQELGGRGQKPSVCKAKDTGILMKLQCTCYCSPLLFARCLEENV